MKQSNNQFKVISFDLDNALYDNQPVMLNAEQVSASYLEQEFERQGKQFSVAKLMQLRKQLHLTNDRRFEDLSFFRQTALKRYCAELDNADEIAAQAFQLFIQQRSKALVPKVIYQLLESLAQRYILVSVSNGNCKPEQLSIASFLTQSYSASDGFRAKPHPEMLLQVANDFDISPAELLHVGDSIESDGGAALNAGVVFFHFSPFEKPGQIEPSCKNILSFLE